MSLPVQESFNESTANGAATVFPYTFKVFQASHLVVKVDGETVDESDYSLSGIGDEDGGDVTFDTAPAANAIVLIYRDIPLRRTTEYTTNGPFIATTVNKDFDLLWMALQGFIGSLTGALRLPYPEESAELVAAASRLDRVLAFDPTTGAPEMSAFTVTQVQSAIAAAYLGGAASTLDALAFIQAGTGAGSRSAQDKMREWVSFRDFLCDDGQFVQLNGVHEDSTGIQKALDYARITGRQVRPGTAGIALLEQRVFFPDGCNFRGEGYFEGGSGILATIFKASSGFKSGSVLGVYGHVGGSRRFWGGDIGHFGIFGNTGAADQFGLEFTDQLDRAVCPQDISYIHDIFPRYCPDGGFNFPDGVLPAHLARLRPFWNGGPGLTIDNNSQPNSMANIHGLSGDGNNGGLLLLKNFNEYNVVNVYGMKAERYDSPDFPGGDEQKNPIVLEDCDNLRLNLFGPHSISAVPSGGNFKKPGDLVKVASGGAPCLSWMGAVTRVRGTDIGVDPTIITSGGVSIPYSVPTGSFSPAGEERVDAAVDGNRFSTWGGGSYANRSVETGGIQVAGITPGYTWHEQDAGANSKTWLTAASAGALTRRVVSDAGVATVYETVERIAAAPFKITWAVPVAPGLFTKAAGASVLPGASARANTVAMISDPAAGKGRLVYSDGTDWRYVSDDSVV